MNGGGEALATVNIGVRSAPAALRAEMKPTRVAPPELCRQPNCSKQRMRSGLAKQRHGTRGSGGSGCPHREPFAVELGPELVDKVVV